MIYLAGLVIEVDDEGVGETGDPGVDFLSLHGELHEVFSPERRSEFCRLKPVPREKINTSYLFCPFKFF